MVEALELFFSKKPNTGIEFRERKLTLSVRFSLRSKRIFEIQTQMTLLAF